MVRDDSNYHHDHRAKDNTSLGEGKWDAEKIAPDKCFEDVCEVDKVASALVPCGAAGALQGKAITIGGIIQRLSVPVILHMRVAALHL